VATRVLIVDDSPAFLWWARRLLESEGLQVVGTAATGTQALADAVDLRPDVVLLDVQLPDTDGFAVCRHLRRAGLRVVLCSVRAAGDYGTRIAESGATGFLPKERLSAAALTRLLG
jgi:two-component system, chemotaxis family, chemotaxis protein CheY